MLIGRNGMHRYNNMDHSMMTAMVAVDNILEGRTDKSNIWAVNTEREYHESKQSEPAGRETSGLHRKLPIDPPAERVFAPKAANLEEEQDLVLSSRG